MVRTIALFFLLLSAVPGRPQAEESPLLDLPALPGQVLVRFRPQVTPQELALAAEWTSSAFLQRIAPWGLCLFAFPEGIPVDEMLQRFRSCPGVLEVQPNHKISPPADALLDREAALVAGRLAGSRLLVALPESAFPPMQGIRGLHRFSSSREIPRDRLDNDRNGYVDDTEGYDFYNQTPEVQGGPGAAQDRTASLLRWLIRGSPDRAIRLLPLRTGVSSWATTASLCEAIAYGIDQRSDLIFLGSSEWWRSPMVSDALHRAAENRILLVSAVGQDLPAWSQWAAAFPPTIWVPSSGRKSWDVWFSRFRTDLFQTGASAALDGRDAIRPEASRQLANHGKVTPAAGKVREAARLVSSEKQFLRLPARTQPDWDSASWSFSFWVNLQTVEDQTFHQCLIAKGVPGKRPALALYTSHPPGNLSFNTVSRLEQDPAAYPARIHSEPLVLGQWHFVVGAYDQVKQMLYFYLDGKRQGMATLLGGSVSDNSPLEICRGFVGGAVHYLNGRIDELAIWTRALDAREVSELYNQGQGNPYSPKTGKFTLDSGEGLSRELAFYYPLDEQEPAPGSGRQGSPLALSLGAIGGLVLLGSLIKSAILQVH